MKANVLIIEDELSLAELISMYLKREGIETTIALSAEDAEKELSRSTFDLITLDINLPGRDGYEFLQRYRREKQTPVIIVSAREADEDIILGLGIGADDFVLKPFSPKVLTARIRAVLRRMNQSGPERSLLRFSGFTLDLDAFLLKKGEERIDLSAKEFEVLAYLAQSPGKTITAEMIYQDVWGNAYGDITTVGVYIYRLRRKLEENPNDPEIIRTFKGKGYQFNKGILD